MNKWTSSFNKYFSYIFCSYTVKHWYLLKIFKLESNHTEVMFFSKDVILSRILGALEEVYLCVPASLTKGSYNDLISCGALVFMFTRAFVASCPSAKQRGLKKLAQGDSVSWTELLRVRFPILMLSAGIQSCPSSLLLPVAGREHFHGSLRESKRFASNH